jgi:DNA-binding transcriptional LysR family regulator
MNRQFAASGIVLKPKLELDSMASALRLVRAGGWATCLPASAVRDRVQLQTHQIVSPVITCSLTAVHAREHAEISWERKFINLIADQLPH